MSTKCSKNFEAISFVGQILAGQFERHGQHGGAVHAHPGGAIGLLHVDSLWQGA